MKIGILTFHRAVNYGAVLQAYALAEKIKEMGQDVQVIDYECKKIKNDYFPNFNCKGKGKTYLIHQIIGAPLLLIRRLKFQKFIEEYLPLSATGTDIRLLTKDYDLIIVGSDQVWQDNLIGGDDAFFLKDVDVKYKASYAASFSQTQHKINRARIELLKKFDWVSIREKENVPFLEKELHRNIEVVCDPSLLLSEQKWKDFTTKCNDSKENYILVFNVLKGNSMFQFAEYLAETTNKRIVVLTTSIKKRVRGEYIRAADPLQFLSLFEHADYIITNSFHGTAFSLIFNKKFYVEVRAGGDIINTRVINLFETLNIPAKRLDGWNDIITVEEDYDSINTKLNNYSLAGEMFLRKILLEEPYIE